MLANRSLAGCHDCGAPLEAARRAGRVCSLCEAQRAGAAFAAAVPTALERFAALVGPEYRDRVLADFSPTLAACGEEAFLRHLKRTGVFYGLLLQGDVGRGKTAFAAAMVRLWVLTGATVRWLPVRQFFQRLNDTYRYGTEAEGDIVDPAKAADLLVLDDLGREGKASDHVLAVLHSLLDDRIFWHRPTIITTNCGDELADRYQAAIADRLELYDTLVIDGPSRRQMRGPA